MRERRQGRPWGGVGTNEQGLARFFATAGGLLKGAGCGMANKPGCKNRDSPQPERRRRRAQQGQRVDCILLSEGVRNETECREVKLESLKRMKFVVMCVEGEMAHNPNVMRLLDFPNGTQCSGMEND
jgi:hypothetical protein